MALAYIAIGSNLPAPAVGAPDDVVRAALTALRQAGLTPNTVSELYRTTPVPASDQPDFANAVVAVDTALAPAALLTILHRIEADFGRDRGVANAPRTLDLDLLDVGGQVATPGVWPTLPHPRLAQRAFVLLPLRDVAPDWRHPVTGQGIDELVAALGEVSGVRAIGALAPREAGA